MEVELYSRLLALEGASPQTLDVQEAKKDCEEKEIVTLVVSNIAQVLEL